MLKFVVKAIVFIAIFVLAVRCWPIVVGIVIFVSICSIVGRRRSR